MTSQVVDYGDRESIVNEDNGVPVVHFRDKDNETKRDRVLDVELDQRADGTDVHIHIYA